MIAGSKNPHSETLLGSSSHTAPKDRTSDGLIDDIERIHDALDPGLVNLRHELPHSVFGLSTSGVVGKQSTLPRRRSGGRTPRGIRRVSRRAGIWVHQEHEFDVAAGEEAVDVVVLETVHVLEVSGDR